MTTQFGVVAFFSVTGELGGHAPRTALTALLRLAAFPFCSVTHEETREETGEETAVANREFEGELLVEVGNVRQSSTGSESWSIPCLKFFPNKRLMFLLNTEESSIK